MRIVYMKEILKTKMAGRKRKSLEDVISCSTNEGDEEPKSKKKKKEAKPLDPKKFGGMTEEEVCKLVLPDHMKADMDIIFVSSNFIIHHNYVNLLSVDWHQSWTLFCLPRPPLL